MKNITLSMDEALIEESRDYARSQGTTLNQLVRDLLAREIGFPKKSKLEEMFEWADRMKLSSNGPYLTREEANERP